ncbi:hypothetical protein CYMTET_31018, partial [Cymbomonas tetramitiformis]
RGELYTKRDQQRIQRDEKPKDPQVSDQELKQRALRVSEGPRIPPAQGAYPLLELEDRTEWMVGSDQAGIDLDDPQTRQELEQHAKKRREQEMQDKAKEMGIDLNDPEVQKALDMFAKEKEAADQLGQLPPISKWRRYLVRAIDPDKMFNVQRVVYVLIAINVGFRIYNTMQQMPRSAPTDDVGSVWASDGEF